MKDIPIGIIGGTGGIGQWFARFFTGQGLPVHIRGKDAGMPLRDLAEACPVVVVAVPLGVTREVIREVGPLMPEGSLLMDLTSLKAEPVRDMLAATKADVIGGHPLFGPDVPDLSGQNMVLCPARGRGWLPWLRGILERNGAQIVETTPERHDEMMALVQGLTHLNTILMGLTLRDAGADPDELAPFSTPVFRTRAAEMEKVLHGNPALYAGIITGNNNMADLIEIYEKNLSLLRDLVRSKDAAGLAARLNMGYKEAGG